MTTDITTPSAETIVSTEDPNGAEDPREYALRQQLGLRPIFYKHTEDDENVSHPDSRPCPAWCEMGQMGFQHSIDAKRPLQTSHDSTVVATLASLYHGYQEKTGVLGATIECKLTSRGQGRGLVELHLRGNNLDTGTTSYERLLNLTLDDASDLVTALQYLIAQADADQLLNGPDGRERNAFEIGRDYERGQQ